MSLESNTKMIAMMLAPCAVGIITLIIAPNMLAGVLPLLVLFPVAMILTVRSILAASQTEHVAADAAESNRDANVSRYLNELGAIDGELTVIWQKQIDTCIQQSEQAISDLTMRFNGIVEKLEVANSLSSQQSDDTQGFDLVDFISSCEEALRCVLETLKATMENRDGLLREVQGLLAYIDELKGMASSVSKIAAQTNLLALNAAIEAARAGEMGRGFSIVADEVRALSSKSGETGELINKTVKVISEGITSTFKNAEEIVKADDQGANRSRERINGVLEQFRQVADNMEKSSEILRACNKEIQIDVANSIVHFQFQDRISQILSHVQSNIAELPNEFRRHAEGFSATGQLPTVQWQVLANSLESSYATREEEINHQGSSIARHSASKSDAVTFF